MRILIPGIYCTSLFFFFAYVVFPELYSTVSQTFLWLLFFISSLVIGLTIYAKETPKKRKVFQTNLPSHFLAERSRTVSDKPLTDDEARRMYFYILNHHMPITVHDKVLFFGMIYFVMINIRRLSFWFGIAGIAAVFFQYGTLGYISQNLILLTIMLWVIYFLNVRYNKADRKIQENYQDQIFWLELNLPIIDSLLQHRTEIQK